MMPKIVLLVGVGVVGVLLAAPVPQTRHYVLVRRGRLITNKEELTNPRRPGHYEDPTSCGHDKCPSRRPRFTCPGSVDRHWVRRHNGQIPKDWVEPKTVQETTRVPKIQCFPLGQTTRTLRWTKQINDKFPVAAKYLKEQRKSRNLFIGHMQAVPDLAAQEAARAPKILAQQQKRRITKALSDSKRQKRRKAQSECLVTDPGPSTQQAAPPPEQPDMQPHKQPPRQHLDIDLNYPPDLQHLDPQQALTTEAGTFRGTS